MFNSLFGSTTRPLPSPPWGLRARTLIPVNLPIRLDPLAILPTTAGNIVICKATLPATTGTWMRAKASRNKVEREKEVIRRRQVATRRLFRCRAKAAHPPPVPKKFVDLEKQWIIAKINKKDAMDEKREKRNRRREFQSGKRYNEIFADRNWALNISSEYYCVPPRHVACQVWHCSGDDRESIRELRHCPSTSSLRRERSRSRSPIRIGPYY